MSVVNSEVPPSPSLQNASEGVNASETQLKFTPLHAEAAEKYSRWFKLEMNRGVRGKGRISIRTVEGASEPLGHWSVERCGNRKDRKAVRGDIHRSCCGACREMI